MSGHIGVGRDLHTKECACTNFFPNEPANWSGLPNRRRLFRHLGQQIHVVADHFPLPVFFAENVRGADGDFLDLALTSLGTAENSMCMGS